MNRPAIADAVDRLGIVVSDDAWQRLALHVALLEKWQRRMNLVGRGTLSDVWHRHVLDSLQLLPLIPSGARTLLDLGSGAGFPGLTLAIARPDLAVRLIEADTRKAAFLVEVARQTAPNAEVQAVRIETLPAEPVDVITARALAPLPKLLAWAHQFVSDPTICLFHKGEAAAAELTAAHQDWMMDIDRVPSVTAPAAAILRIARLRPRR